MEMSDEQIKQAIVYFKSIKSKCLIEAEVKESKSANFIEKYKSYNCSDLDKSFYKIADKNKWGIELRLYYVSDDKTPKFIIDKSTTMTRSGYELYNKRLNYNDLINELFKNGFCIGKN